MAPALDLGGAREIVQTESIDQGPDGRLTRGMRVSFLTAKGHRSSVFVAMANYSASKAAAEVKKLATELDALG
jgi:hypothetical protein